MKYRMSETGQEMLRFQAELGVMYKYKPLSVSEKDLYYAGEELRQIRTRYKEELPE